ncbi:[protein-PII] uridylyltransferase [Thermodesulfobacteriota bacterium]
MEEPKTLINEFLESRETQIQESLKQSSGLRTTRRYADLMDQFVRSVFLTAGFKEQIKDSRGRSLVVLALGSYGRREFCFNSDIDLMIVHRARLSEEMRGVAQRALYPLWDAKLEVGHSVLAVQECIRLALNDFRVLTSLLDGRFILGSRFFSRLFEEAFWSRIQREKDSILRQFLIYREKRSERYGTEGYFIEPDIKEGLGGLRDLHFISWMAGVYLGCRDLKQIRHFPAFSNFGIDKLNYSKSFLLNVRNHLHILFRRKEDRLLLTFQGKLSRSLGYEDRPEISGAERFMKDLYLHLNRIRYSAQEFQSKAMDIIAPLPVGSVTVSSAGEFQVHKGNIVLKEGTLSEKDPAIILRALDEANRNGLFLGSGFIWEAKKIIAREGRAILASIEARELFLGIILKPKNAKIIRLALEIGLVTLFIPEFKKIRNLPEFGYYHVETVDLHSLRTLNTVNDISNGIFQEKWPLLGNVFSEIERPDFLFMAALLHDAGKGYGGDHSEKGAEVVRRILKRLGINDEGIDIVPLLIKHHLLLARISQHRDLNDEKTSIQVAQIIQNQDTLRMLFLLTVADSFSTGPIARSDWKVILLSELFVKVSRILEKGVLASPDATKEVDVKKIMVLNKLGRNFSQNEIRSLMNQISTRYFLNTSIEDEERHFRLALNMGEEKLVWELEKLTTAQVTRIILCTYDKPGLFSKMVGALTINNITVLAAHIFPQKSGLVFDIYEVTNPRDSFREQEIWAKVKEDMKMTVEDRLPLDDLIQKKRRSVMDSGKYGGPDIKRAIIDNEITDFFTVLEVTSKARLGMLYELAKEITSHGLDIRFAKFSTDREKISGVFYVRDSLGQKVQEAEKIEQIREGLLETMD